MKRFFLVPFQIFPRRQYSLPMLSDPFSTK